MKTGANVSICPNVKRVRVKVDLERVRARAHGITPGGQCWSAAQRAKLDDIEFS